MQSDVQNQFTLKIKRLRVKRWILSLIRNLMIAAAVIYILFGVVFGLAVVRGDSMNPALYENDLVLFLRIGQYSREDIVLIKTDSSEDYIKRIVGCPNEEIDIDEKTGNVLIDKTVFSQPYISQKTNAKTGVRFPLNLGGNEYFVLGDNRENSADSRKYGPVTKDSIDGKVIAILRVGS